MDLPMTPPRFQTADAATYDRLYRKRRGAGDRPGWTTADELATDTAHLDAFIAHTGLPMTGRAIELGAGAGNITLHLATSGLDICGVELSADALEWARDNARAADVDVSFHLGDACDVEAARAGAWGRDFDLVVDGHCLHWLAGEDRERFLCVSRTILAPGGLLWVRAMCDGPPVAWLADGGTWSRDGVQMRWDPERHLVLAGELVVCSMQPARAILAEVEDAGLEVLHRHLWPPADDQDAAELFCLARKPVGLA
jgi:SAM-dependent methyltransferase